MDLDFSRRDILFAATGSAVGIALSPLPWKLLGDSAIWTQRSRFAPELLRGDVTTRLSACTLCPAGCALRARCVGGRPVSMAPVPGHPVSRGALCATGFALHHLPAHPLRLKGPAQIAPKSGGVEAVSRGADVAVAAVADAVRKARSAGAAVPVAFLDLRPGRAASLESRRLLAAVPGAVHLAGPSHQGGTLDALRTRLEETAPLGVDLDRPRTIVSSGLPSSRDGERRAPSPSSSPAGTPGRSAWSRPRPAAPRRPKGPTGGSRSSRGRTPPWRSAWPTSSSPRGSSPARRA